MEVEVLGLRVLLVSKVLVECKEDLTTTFGAFVDILDE